VARRIVVTDLDVTVGIAGNILDDDFDPEDLAAGVELKKLKKAEVTGVEGGPVSAQTVTLTDASASLTYLPDRIELNNFHLGSIEVEGIHYSGELKELSSSGKATI
jgi:hypothetical protein